MRAHWSDGHLYSGDRVRKLQDNHYFLIDTGAGEKVFLHLHDAECYCMEHKLDPDEVIKSGDPETWLRAIKLAQTNSFILKEQSERLHKLMDAVDQEIDRLVAVRDRHEETQKRNFDREFDAEQVRNAVAKRSGLYAAYKDTMDRHFYFNQIVLLARKP